MPDSVRRYGAVLIASLRRCIPSVKYQHLMRMIRACILFAFGTMASAVPGHAGSKAEIVASQICRNFSGIFRWDKPGLPQFVTMQIREIAVPSDSTVVLIGTGRYVVFLTDDQVSLTNMEFRWEIDAPSLKIVMQETNPDTETFITDGDYRGKISPDLLVIQTRWRTNGTQETGVLQLRATSDCRSGV